jgi:phosphoglucomutase
MAGSEVVSVRNFEKEIIHDVEGDEIPKQMMMIFQLADKTRVAIRGSGTEPKIKYYLFAQRRPATGEFTQAQLDAIKPEVARRLDALWEWVRQDAHARAGV